MESDGEMEKEHTLMPCLLPQFLEHPWALQPTKDCIITMPCELLKNIQNAWDRGMLHRWFYHINRTLWACVNPCKMYDVDEIWIT